VIDAGFDGKIKQEGTSNANFYQRCASCYLAGTPNIEVDYETFSELQPEESGHTGDIIFL
jgi:hypothetical protein